LAADTLAPGLNRFLFGLGCSLPVWFAMGIFWASAAAAISRSESKGDPRQIVAGLVFGIALGLGTSILLVSPWIGPWNAVALAAIGLIVFKAARARGTAQNALIPVGSARQMDSTPLSMPHISTADSLAGPIAEMLQVLAVLAFGGLLAVEMRVAGQLVPAACHYLAAEWIGLLVGFGTGVLMRTSRGNSTTTHWTTTLVPAAMGVCLIAFLPQSILLALWMTTSITAAWLLMSLRMLLLASVVASIGFGMAGLIATGAALHRRKLPGESPPQSSNAWLSVVFAIGFTSVTSCFGGVDAIWLLTVCCYVLAGIGMWNAQPFVGASSRRGAAFLYRKEPGPARWQPFPPHCGNLMMIRLEWQSSCFPRRRLLRIRRDGNRSY
jgi:hypothetical protein